MNPFFDVPPLSSGSPVDVIPVQTGADSRWDAMAEFFDKGTGDAGGTASGAFYTQYTDGAGDIFLQGGTINGLAVNTSDLKLYDLGTTSWEGNADDHLYIPISGQFTVVDSVALPGFVIGSIGTITIGTPPANTFPAVTGPTTSSFGVCNVSLGVFTDTGFLPSAQGNRVIGLCITPPYSGDV